MNLTKDEQIKKIIFGEEVRKKILRGVSTTNKVVSTTLGSRGRNVCYELNWGEPNIIHDGVTAAKQVVLEDYFENQAAQLVIKAAQDTNNVAGDGTTTATILTYAIVKEGLKLVSAGTNPMEIREGIEKAVKTLIQALNKQAKPIKEIEKMKQIASISAASKEIGEIISEAIQKVGEAGVVTVQDGVTSDISVEYKDGMEFDKGLVAPHQMTMNTERIEAELKDPYIVIFNDKLDNNSLIKLLSHVYDNEKGAEVIIIADSYDPVTLTSLVLNKIRGGFKVVGVESPEFGEHRTNLLNDIALATGGKVIGGNSGLTIEQVKDKSFFGRADKVISEKEKTVIIGGKRDKKLVDARISGLKKAIENEPVVFVKDKLQSRLSRLIGGVAVINVGANSQTEQRELKERVIDAVNATRAAVEQGIVAGGGVALLKASREIDKLLLKDKFNAGLKIVKQACLYPMRKLVQNTGVEDSGIVIGEILKNDNENIGYNVDTKTFEDMFVSGIIDPVKVTKTALSNAASTAIMLLTTEVMICYRRKEETKEEELIDSELGIGQMPN